MINKKIATKVAVKMLLTFGFVMVLGSLFYFWPRGTLFVFLAAAMIAMLGMIAKLMYDQEIINEEQKHVN